MYLTLAGTRIGLDANHPAVREGWERLFAGWPHRADAEGSVPRLALTLELAPRLPDLPDGSPAFADALGIVDVYCPEPGRFLLHYRDGALVTVVPAANRAAGTITPAVLGRDRLEDVTYTSLAPLLRRHDRYLLHAFAATRAGQALLLVGRSGSGKTTTGLNLLLSGWGLLANDVVLLHRRDGQVYACPTPGALTVRPTSLELLPALDRRAGRFDPALNSYSFRARAVTDEGWAAAAPVRTLCFPTVTGAATSRVDAEPAAVAFARLLEESVDRWDGEAVGGHLALLQQLSEQAAAYRLGLGRDLARHPALLSRLLDEGALPPDSG